MIANFMVLSKCSKKYRFEGIHIYTVFSFLKKKTFKARNMNSLEIRSKINSPFGLTLAVCAPLPMNHWQVKRYTKQRVFSFFLLANNLNKDINLLPFIEGLLKKKIENTEVLARTIFSLAALGRLFLFGANVSFKITSQ